MSGYVASARIVRAAPRLARADTVRDGFAERSASPAVETLIVDFDPSVAAGRSTLVDRVEAVRERWSQLTFYLFDPNSWH
jgi:hypothetical protein